MNNLLSSKFLPIIFSVTLFSCQETGGRKPVELKTNLDNSTHEKNSLSDQPKKQVSENTYYTLSLLSDKFKVKIPQQLQPMDLQMFKLKYPLENPGMTSAYSNPEGTVSLLVSQRPEKATSADLARLKQTYTENFRSNPSIEVIDSEIKTLNGKDFFILKMITPAADTRVYNEMFVTTSERRLVISTLNCTIKEMNEWLPRFKKISSSIIVRD